MRSTIPAIDYQVEVISAWNTVESFGPLANAFNSTGPASTAWPSANLAIFIPFRIRHRFTVRQIFVGVGATAGGNFDCGVYDRYGNRIVSSGSTARSVSAENVANVTDTELYCGMYYMALSVDGTNTIMASVPAAADLLKLAGVKQMATAFTLPATATFASITSAYLPVIGLYRSAL